MRRTTRLTILRLTTLALATALAVSVAACSSSTPDEAPSSAARTSSDASPSATEEPAEAASPEIGTWESAPVPRREFERTIIEAGFRPHIDAFFKGLGSVETMALALTLEDGFWTLTFTPDDEATEIADRGTYERAGRRLVVSNGSGTNVFAYTIKGDQLRLRFVSSTEPNYLGAPVEAILRGLYTTTPFTRVPA